MVGLGILLILCGIVLNPWVVERAARDGRIDSGFLRGVIVVGDLLLIAAGAALIRYRPRLMLREAALTVTAMLVPLLLLELGLRGRWWGPPTLLEPSPVIGWAPPAFDTVRLDNEPFGVRHYTTGPHGFRRYPVADSVRATVLFIGDSFTQATEVSDGRAYYDRVASARPGLAVFAFGARGHSSMQEYLALDLYLEEVRPDLIVWQLASNDLVTNDHDLERRHWGYNNQATRPYLEDDTVVYRLPIESPILRHSHLARFVAVRLALLRGAAEGEDAIGETFRHDPRARDRALRTTARILERAAARAGDVPLVAFQVDRPEWLGSSFADIASELDIPFIEGIPDSILAAKERGQRVDFSPRDGHWNEEGHALAGDVLLKSLVGRGLLPPAGR